MGWCNRGIYLSSATLLFGLLSLTLRVQPASLRNCCFNHSNILARLSQSSEIILDVKGDGINEA